VNHSTLDREKKQHAVFSPSVFQRGDSMGAERENRRPTDRLF
jgi:hypothetical protein